MLLVSLVFNFGHVFMTTFGKGLGIQTMENLAIGYFVFEFVSEIVTNAKMAYHNKVYEDCKR